MPSLLFPSLPFPSPLSGRRFPFVLNVRSAACRLKRESGGNRDSLQHGTDGGAASVEAISLEPSCPGRRRCRSQNFTIVNHGAAMAEREGGSTGDWAASRVSEPPLTADIKSPASRVICLISITHSGLAGPGGSAAALPAHKSALSPRETARLPEAWVSDGLARLGRRQLREPEQWGECVGVDETARRPWRLNSQDCPTARGVPDQMGGVGHVGERMGGCRWEARRIKPFRRHGARARKRSAAHLEDHASSPNRSQGLGTVINS